MDIVVGAVGIATDFIPVPGLKPAFGILKFIWDSVQTTSNNRRSLRNLAVSSTELFMAVNRVLTKIDINDHLQDLLLKFQDVLEGIRDFAKEHAEVNLFRLLMRNVDVVGKIEYFQTRLQNLSMAFSIAAYGDLRTQLGRLLEMRDLSSTSIQDQEHSTVSLDTVTTTNQRTHIRDYEPQRVKVSYSESCTVETRGGVPVLASRYDKDMEFSTWGISAGSSTAVTEAGSFDVLSDGGAALWTWSLMKNRITSFDLNPAYTDWRDRMDISFPDDATAASWFNWLQAYATTDAVDTVPQRCEVSVRTTYHCWLQKTPDSIQHRRSGRAPWVMTLVVILPALRRSTAAETLLFMKGPFELTPRSLQLPGDITSKRKRWRTGGIGL
ncbi:hypothetical protein JB92DRAFT_652307 [Gautieria morchelliformis]|nr:hypothetical protein JB92DRAFT_652307 [Gautieria morchelliformis]